MGTSTEKSSNALWDCIETGFFSLKVLLHTILNVMYGTGLDFLVEVVVGVK